MANFSQIELNQYAQVYTGVGSKSKRGKALQLGIASLRVPLSWLFHDSSKRRPKFGVAHHTRCRRDWALPNRYYLSLSQKTAIRQEHSSRI